MSLNQKEKDSAYPNNVRDKFSPHSMTESSIVCASALGYEFVGDSIKMLLLRPAHR